MAACRVQNSSQVSPRFSYERVSRIRLRLSASDAEHRLADEAEGLDLADPGSEFESRERVWLDRLVLFRRRVLFDCFHLRSRGAARIRAAT